MNKIVFSVDTEELRKKVNFVRNGLGSNRTDLITQLIRVGVTGNKLTLFATNKEMFCRAEMRLKKEDSTDGVFSVLGGKLTSLVNSSEAEQIKMEVDQENLKAVTGFLTVNFTLYDGAGLKQIEQAAEQSGEEGTVIDRSALEEALSCGKVCTTTNAIRPDFNHVELRKGQMLASDGRKVMMYSNLVFDKKTELKVPSGILSSIISSLKNIDTEKLQVLETPAYYIVKAGLTEYVMGVRKIERTFPDIEGMVAAAAQPDDEVSIDKHVFVGALQGVALGLESEEVKVTIDVEGKGTEAFLEVSCQNNLGRRSYERTACGRTGTGTRSFPVSVKHLLDTLSVFKGDSVVDLGINSKLAFLVVTDKNEAREVLTLIPFRTDTVVNQEKIEAAKEKETKAKIDTEEEAREELAEATELG